jgi:hypothetical protein
MGGWYQRRTQKGMMGRTEKITLTGVTKNPRLLQACNITSVKRDMCEFFFISIVDENGLNKFNDAKKNNFLKVLQYFIVKF